MIMLTEYQYIDILEILELRGPRLRDAVGHGGVVNCVQSCRSNPNLWMFSSVVVDGF